MCPDEILIYMGNGRQSHTKTSAAIFKVPLKILTSVTAISYVVQVESSVLKVKLLDFWYVVPFPSHNMLRAHFLNSCKI